MVLSLRKSRLARLGLSASATAMGISQTIVQETKMNAEHQDHVHSISPDVQQVHLHRSRGEYIYHNSKTKYAFAEPDKKEDEMDKHIGKNLDNNIKQINKQAKVQKVGNLRGVKGPGEYKAGGSMAVGVLEVGNRSWREDIPPEWKDKREKWKNDMAIPAAQKKLAEILTPDCTPGGL